jgi:hypothetical protein
MSETALDDKGYSLVGRCGGSTAARQYEICVSGVIAAALNVFTWMGSEGLRTMLQDALLEALQDHPRRICRQYEAAAKSGLRRGPPPDDLARKYINADRSRLSIRSFSDLATRNTNGDYYGSPEINHS